MHSSLRALTGFAFACFSLLASASPLVAKLNVRAPAQVSGWTYSGCFKDTPGARVLDGNSYFSDTMTVQICATFCANNNFPVFGVEYGRECFCGPALRIGTATAPEVECSTPCNGDTSQTCGNGDRLNVYQKEGTATSSTSPSSSPSPSPPAPIPTSYTFQNCYSEATTGRALTGKATSSDTQTIENCAASCAGFKYFGLEYYFECFCGNDLKAGSIPVGGVECSFKCTGNPAQTCGGDSRLSLYSFGDNPPPSPPSSSSTTTTASSIAVTPTPIQGIEALGCYTDSTSARVLKGAVYYDDGMTIEKCSSACTAFKLFGLEYGRECYCSNEIKGSNEVLASQCSMLCAGNPSQKCGAGDRLNVYKYVPIPTTTTTTTSITTTSVAVPTNILKNPSFEDDLAFWELSSLYGGVGSVWTGPAPAGYKYIRMRQVVSGALSESTRIISVKQEVTVVTGTTYKVDLWVYRGPISCGVTVRLNDILVIDIGVIPEENIFLQITGEVVAQPNIGQVDFVSVELVCSGLGVQAAGIDNVRFIPVPVVITPTTTLASTTPEITTTSTSSSTTTTTTSENPTTTTTTTTTTTLTTTTTTESPTPTPINILVNSDFELGTSWDSGGSPGTEGVITTTNPHLGTYAFSFKATPQVSSPTTWYLQQWVNIIPSATYQVKLWSNRLNGDCTIYSRLLTSTWDGPGDSHYFVIAPGGAPSGWTEWTGVQTLSANILARANFVVEVYCQGMGLQQIMVDDVSLALVI